VLETVCNCPGGSQAKARSAPGGLNLHGLASDAAAAAAEAARLFCLGGVKQLANSLQKAFGGRRQEVRAKAGNCLKLSAAA
jgi:hypothetical protein